MKEKRITFQIRMALPDDAPAIASVLYDSFAEYKSLYTEGAFAATTLNPAQTLQRISEGPVWVAVKNGMIIGTVAAVREGDTLSIRGMAILPEERGQRIAELLLQEIEGFAPAVGCGRLFLRTAPFLVPAIKLYERAGFERVSGGEGELFGTPLLAMDKLLGAR